ncbi:peptidoglycan DD-metalloendopeptidase family protein [Calothrix sp. UHCC 0171]|uniref:peptidoglycan DD-metalloendopeptidase family protein n=1 Tax=Calothrix sp. UHCC 0171 TaxID=3110245 RepID=UPI002B20F7B5|nr:peptidoglycan DD-metalloendopeptidase family protein [Calothrix sp. UHCC 0171]MEA5570343.1 peptidoglycan DD-metalloendopeptidase family protein [Calothrix sp. UHCC 0171]
MKRALKKKVKAAQESNPSEDVPVDNLNEPNLKINRHKRTSVAMIGLAISMGATSLLVTRQSDQALAAEPVANQNTASTTPAADNAVRFAATIKLDTKATSNMSVPENPVIVEPTAISQIPGLGAKLQVAASGASLQVPTPTAVTNKITAESKTVTVQDQAAKAQQIADAIARVQANREQAQKVEVAEELSSNQAATTSTVVLAQQAENNKVNEQLQAQQEFAINRLRQKSNRLKESLAELRSGETKVSLPQQEIAAEITNPESNSVVDASVNNIFPVPASTVKTEEVKSYEVKPGDTLAAIAIKHGISVADIAKANGIANPNQLRISQKLNLPVAKTSVTKNKATVATTSSASTVANVTAPVTPVAVPTAIPTPVITSNTSQTVASTITSESADIPANANGVGGETPVPKVFAEMQLASRNHRNKQVKDDPGLRSLQAEIERLRERYRSQQAGKRDSQQKPYNNTVAVPIPVSTENTVAVPTVPTRDRRNVAIPVPTYRTNTVAVPIPVPTPMAPNYNAQPINPEWARNVRNGGRMSNPPVPTSTNASESLGNMRGTVVTPQLPPLAAVDRYLPRPVDENTRPAPGNAAYIWPAKGVLTSGYGWRWGRMHKGIDVANSVGTPIYASAPGVVEKAGWNKGGYGLLVEIRHPDGSMTRYAHNSRILVSQGQQVQQGDTIAAMGSTGFSTGPHTHFEIHTSGKGAVNPIAMLAPRV